MIIITNMRMHFLVPQDCSPLLLSSCMKMISSESRSANLLSRLRLSSTSQVNTSLMQMFKAASFSIQRNINKVVNLLPVPYRLVVMETIITVNVTLEVAEQLMI